MTDLDLVWPLNSGNARWLARVPHRAVCVKEIEPNSALLPLDAMHPFLEWGKEGQGRPSWPSLQLPSSSSKSTAPERRLQPLPIESDLPFCPLLQLSSSPQPFPILGWPELWAWILRRSSGLRTGPWPVQDLGPGEGPASSRASGSWGQAAPPGLGAEPKSSVH
ncbi:feather keratin 4-like [Platysternon megacephalum]|uniref:Feather keratin 4-like n=1 Tax=Platysternon megacephalum TaxID=55544 RepID=A0A4D9DNJ0_9SAUR|nr:feather keratin 4-like [Platysternon megacephalum]